MTAEQNIENLYKVFKKYSLPAKIYKCPCGCISDKDEQKIYSKSLKELNAEDIGFYNTKAMTTWGNEENYKHFLPRIIEIYKEDKTNGWIDIDTIYNKLEYANWKDWNEEEQMLLNKFVEIDWKELVNKTENEIWTNDFEFYLNYFDFDDLLEMWTFPENEIALKNFVEFFYMNGNQILYSDKSIKIKGKDRKRELINVLQRDNLIQRLEEEFFEKETIEENYAEKVSIVLQMIEMKTQGNNV